MKEWQKTYSNQLGMPLGTASNKLRRRLMFKFMKELNRDVCFQCGKKIEVVEELSIEHKVPWRGKKNAKELFFDLSNLAFSHLKCNSGASAHPNIGKRTHGIQSTYNLYGCRCELCRKVQSDKMKKYHEKTRRKA